MKLKYTILYVEDVAASLAFYEKAFGLTLGMLHESGDYGELATGDTKLAFSSLQLVRELGKSPGVVAEQRPSFEIAFETEDVASALEIALAAGAKLVQAVEQMPWGQETCYVTDLDGFLVEICSPVEISS